MSCNSVNLIKLFLLWIRGQLHNDSCLYPIPIPIIWYGRIGSFLIFIAGLAIVVDIIGDDGLKRLGQFLENNSRIRAKYMRKLALLGTPMMKKGVDLPNQPHPPRLLSITNGILFWFCVGIIFFLEYAFTNNIDNIWNGFNVFNRGITTAIKDCFYCVILLILTSLFARFWLRTSECFLRALSRGMVELASLLKKYSQRANQEIKIFSLALLVVGFILQLLTTN